MITSILSSSLSGLNVSKTRLQQSAHNVANVSTAGFVPNRIDVATLANGGAQVVGTTPTSSGAIQFTGHQMDLAIDGGGFFTFSDSQYGQVYSRAGNLSLNSDGNVVDSSGRSLIPNVTLPASTSQININPQGVLTAFDSSGNELAQLQIETAFFPNAAGLQAVGGNAFSATQASGPAVFNAPGTAGHGNIVSGALRTSGTDLAHEMVEQITSQRSFEANIKTIQTYDEMLSTVLDIKA